ncbi:hypothetical protein EAH80_18365 [Mycobacterium hodleri]|uniref:Uncharacterized protein n=1 Tax=Mycolicibacterium hodleri TaxID=49897 RepID=A0A502E4X4_9MYCO|nr:hypothetical protein EAH80_18365 [Mycolicibacterium hodleri]
MVDDAVPVLAGSVLVVGGESTDESGAGPEVPESVDVLAVSLGDELLGWASALPGLVVIATPSPSATAKAPTRPTYLALPIMAPHGEGCPAQRDTTPTVARRKTKCMIWRASLSPNPGRSSRPLGLLRTPPCPALQANSLGMAQP